MGGWQSVGASPMHRAWVCVHVHYDVVSCTLGGEVVVDGQMRKHNVGTDPPDGA